MELAEPLEKSSKACAAEREEKQKSASSHHQHYDVIKTLTLPNNITVNVIVNLLRTIFSLSFKKSGWVTNYKFRSL